MVALKETVASSTNRIISSENTAKPKSLKKSKKEIRKSSFLMCLRQIPDPIQVAEQTGIAYGTFGRWCWEDPEYKREVERILADSFNYILTLSLAHAKKSVPMCIYLLKCLGGERFHEKTEQVVSVRYENKYNYAGNITDAVASPN